MAKNTKSAIEGLLTLSMGKLFVRLAIPGMLGSMVTGLYTLADAIFVGRYVGKEGIGAISLAYPVVLLNMALANLVGVGSMSLLSRALGENDPRKAHRLLGNCLLMVAILAVICSIVIFLLTRSIILVLGGGGEIVDLGEKYLRMLSTGFVFAALGPVTNMMIRAEGNIKKAMAISASGATLNLALDPLLIQVFRMGIAGAALATIIAQASVFVLAIRHFRLSDREYRLKFRDVKIARDLLGKVLAIGVSALIMLVLVALQQSLIFRSVAHYGGSDHIVLIGVALRTYLFTFIPIVGIGQGMQPVIGMNYGAAKYGRVKEAFWFFTLAATAIAAVLWLCFLLIPGLIMSGFITDSDLVSRGVRYFRSLFILYFLSGINVTSVILFQSLGSSVKAGILAGSRQVLFFAVLLLLLPRFFGVLGVWITLPVSDGMTLVLSVVLLVAEYKRLNSLDRNKVSEQSSYSAP